MEPLHILIVDDDEYTMADYRDALEEGGCTVTSATSLQEAGDILVESMVGGSAKIEFVLIDLMLGSRRMPTLVLNGNLINLNDYYKGLTSQKNNEGQALGQWLWQTKTESNNFSVPNYCYFTTVAGHHQRHTKDELQEFAMPGEPGKYDKSNISKFVLAKPSIMPHQLREKIQDILQLWKDLKFDNKAQEKL
jgi:CheY-like chemotaxis protein